MKEYKKIKLFYTNAELDLLSGALWELEIGGITEENFCLEVFYDAINSNIPEEIKNVCEILKEQELLESYTLIEESVENKNWNEEWEKNLNVIKPADRIVIKPSSKDYNAEENDLIITIDPKMSFGTGEHATTRIVITLLEKHFADMKNVLDLGTGTAVLAIAAIKLGAECAMAVDIDEWSILNSRENILLNKVEDKIDLLEGTTADLDETKYDLVLANINTNVLREIKEDIAIRINDNKLLIISGLLNTDKEELTVIYENAGFEKIDEFSEQEWAGLVLRKKPL